MTRNYPFSIGVLAFYCVLTFQRKKTFSEFKSVQVRLDVGAVTKRGNPLGLRQMARHQFYNPKMNEEAADDDDE